MIYTAILANFGGFDNRLLCIAGAGFLTKMPQKACSKVYHPAPMRECFVYILRCSDGSFYTGVTNDYQHRLWQHQEGIDAHCYTYKRRPVELVYVGIFGDINEAISWEKKVKRWSRRKKEALIRHDFMALSVLSKKRNFHRQE